MLEKNLEMGLNELSKSLEYAYNEVRTVVHNYTQEKLPEGWVERYDQSGKPYFYETKTRTSTYAHPTSQGIFQTKEERDREESEKMRMEKDSRNVMEPNPKLQQQSMENANIRQSSNSMQPEKRQSMEPERASSKISIEKSSSSSSRQSMEPEKSDRSSSKISMEKSSSVRVDSGKSSVRMDSDKSSNLSGNKSNEMLKKYGWA